MYSVKHPGGRASNLCLSKLPGDSKHMLTLEKECCRGSGSIRHMANYGTEVK